MSDPMATARAEILRPKAISPPGDEFGREKRRVSRFYQVIDNQGSFTDL
jgi:hypothetical protein